VIGRGALVPLLVQAVDDHSRGVFERLQHAILVGKQTAALIQG
jgi:hypothetical protein